MTAQPGCLGRAPFVPVVLAPVLTAASFAFKGVLVWMINYISPRSKEACAVCHPSQGRRFYFLPRSITAHMSFQAELIRILRKWNY